MIKEHNQIQNHLGKIAALLSAVCYGFAIVAILSVSASISYYTPYDKPNMLYIEIANLSFGIAFISGILAITFVILAIVLEVKTWIKKNY